MENLKNLVKALIAVEEDGEVGIKKRVYLLQEISAKLLTEYYIEVPGITIEPLRVETYYFHPGKFEDSTVHGSPQQRRFDRLYRHNLKENIDLQNENGGVDLCLAYHDNENEDAPYFLSFLIKNSRVNGKKDCKQIELNQLLNESKTDDMDNLAVLRKRSEKPEGDTTVFHTVRTGLNGKPFGREPLASLIDINRKSESDPSKLFFDFATGCGKEQILAEYLREHPEANTEDNRRKWYGGKGGRTTWMTNAEKLNDILKK